jgi:predicted DNA-binding helix-hairpin-helix protein
LVREHRLYQSDWLLRFYGYTVEEILPASHPDLPLDLDPKVAYALRNPGLFPLDVNRAPRAMLLRVPGFGVQGVQRILAARRHRKLTLADLARLHLPLARAKPFILTADANPTAHLLQRANGVELVRRLLVPPTQLSLGL